MFQSTTNAYRLVDTGAQQTSLKKKKRQNRGRYETNHV